MSKTLRYHIIAFPGPSLLLLLLLPLRAPALTVQAQTGEALGAVHFAVSCDASVVEEFDRAVALLHHMTYPAALDAFQAVTQRDPECALGYWGAAMTLFQPLWPTRPSAEDLRRGRELMQEARRWTVEPGREELFVATGEAFFSQEGEPDYWTRVQRWADATADLYRAFPEDREVRAFYALSLLATAPQGDAAEIHAEAARVLTSILAEEPTHPGAVHYTIHANDFQAREHESLHVVRSYGEIAPANAHALHMPTHIFVRLGDWDDVIAGNRRAAAAALRQRVGPGGAWVWDEFPHAVEYLVYAQLQRGDDDGAARLIDSLRQTPDLQPSFKTAFHLASTAVRHAVERHDWERASNLPARTPRELDWDAFPWPEALVWWARGLGAANLADRAPVVEESLSQLTRLGQRASEMGEALFATQIEILRLEVEGWRAFAQERPIDALRLLEEAATLEEQTPKHPVTPAPAIPARELLGDLHLALQNPGAAREAYTTSNAIAPGRLNTLAGLARASVALGDAEAARSYYQRLADQAADSSTRPAVVEARAYLRRPG